MAKTYTFQTQRVLSGVLSFEVVTSTGSGSSTETEKYFSDEITRNNETEFLAGDLKSANLDFTIAYDKDDLFRSTILPVALTDGEFVTVKVSLDGAVKFIGKTEPLTIGYEPFYASNDGLDNQKTAITFKCISILDTAKLITKLALTDRLRSFVIDNGKYVLISSGGVDQYYFYVSLKDLIENVLYLLNSTYSISYTLQFALTDFTFYGKGDGVNDGSYIYPAVTAIGSISDGTIGGDNEPCLLFGTASPATGDPVATGDITLAGLFADDDETFVNAYDYVVGILKSFGLYFDVQHSPTVDLIVTVGTRSSGLQIETVDVLSADETPMSEIARKKINVTSLQSGNSYVKDYPNIGTSEFSYQAPIDFGNDLDFPGLADPSNPVNTAKSLMFPVGTSHFELVRLVGLGSGYLLNPNLDASLDSWTAGGSWVFDGSSPFAFGSARATLTQPSGTAPELSQVLTSEIADGIVFGGLFRTNDADARITIKVYSGSTVIAELTSDLYTDTTQMIYIHLDAKNRRDILSQPVTKISVSAFYVSSPNPSGYVWFGYSFLQRARKGTPQLIGLQIEDLFNDGNLSRQSRTLNGIQDIKPSDYYTYNGEKFYIKRVNWQMKNHETEIEAINYPY
jgi:hypothetical protein